MSDGRNYGTPEGGMGGFAPSGSPKSTNTRPLIDTTIEHGSVAQNTESKGPGYGDCVGSKSPEKALGDLKAGIRNKTSISGIQNHAPASIPDEGNLNSANQRNGNKSAGGMG